MPKKADERERELSIRLEHISWQLAEINKLQPVLTEEIKGMLESMDEWAARVNAHIESHAARIAALEQGGQRWLRPA